jgi:hypothetical protein
MLKLQLKVSSVFNSYAFRRFHLNFIVELMYIQSLCVLVINESNSSIRILF